MYVRKMSSNCTQRSAKLNDFYCVENFHQFTQKWPTTSLNCVQKNWSHLVNKLHLVLIAFVSECEWWTVRSPDRFPRKHTFDDSFLSAFDNERQKTTQTFLCSLASGMCRYSVEEVRRLVVREWEKEIHN